MGAIPELADGCSHVADPVDITPRTPVTRTGKASETW
jgi:hypothetical protein